MLSGSTWGNVPAQYTNVMFKEEYVKYVCVLLIFFCVSCASNNHVSNPETVPLKVECQTIEKQGALTKADAKELEKNCEEPPSNPIGAIIQGGISMAILLALIL